MLLVGKDLASYTLAAGEPFVFEVQLLDSAGRATDLDDQAMILTFYTAGTREVVTDYAGNRSQYEGDRLSDSTGEYFRWAFDGRWSDAMLNRPGLRVELAQRLLNGRRIITTGTLSVISSAAIVPSLPGGLIALTAVRATIKDNPTLGGAPLISQAVIVYDGPSVPVPAPVFTTPTSIASDGTPQVGELLTGIDGVATNAVSYTRRWLLGSTLLTSSATYTPTTAGSYRYETIASGPGGEQTSGSNITVAAATPLPAPTLSISAPIVRAEGNSGTTSFDWILTLNRDGSTASFAYNWAVTPSGANPANAADFGGTFPSGSGTFTSVQSSKTISILAAGDTAFETDETFTITVTAAGLNTVTSNGTITNDDAEPVASGGTVAVNYFSSAANGDTLTYLENKLLGSTLAIQGGNGAIALAGSDTAGWRIVKVADGISSSYTMRETASNGQITDTQLLFTGGKTATDLSSLVRWGVNFGAGAGGSSVVPGTFGFNFNYGTTAQVDMAYFYGTRVFRIPVLEERLISAVGGTVAATYASQLKPVIDYILSLPNTEVIIDPHSYGKVFEAQFKQNQVANAVSIWNDVFGSYKGNARFIPSMQNEPVDAFTVSEFTGTTAEIRAQRAAAWWQVVNAWLPAMRAAGWTQELIVPGMFYQSAESWSTEGNAAGALTVTDTNVTIEVHQYVDSGSGSTTTVVANSQNRFDAAFSAAQAGGYKLQIGETAVPNTADGDALLPLLYNKFEANRAVLKRIIIWSYNTFQPLESYFAGLLNDKPLRPSALLSKHNATREKTTPGVSVVVGTPDGPLEAAMSPPNTTLRSTYAMTAPDGVAIPVPVQMIKQDGTIDGGGVYYAGGGGVKMPSAAYPDRRFWYYGKDHGPGTSATNGIYMSVTVGNPSVAANWKAYEDAVAAGWLADIPNLPASNPIWPGATGSTQPETPYAMWVADDDGSNGKVVMAYQTGGNAKSRYDGTAYRDQATVRGISSDGVHFTGDLVCWAENRPIDAGYAHTGYMHFAKSIFLDFPYKYIAYSLGGVYGCNDPRTEFWQNVSGYDTYGGRMLAGLTSGWSVQRNRWLPATAKRTPQGVSMLTSIGAPQSGAGLAPGAIYEVLMAEDGLEVLAKPQNILGLGAAGSGYEVDVTAHCYGVHGDSEFIVFDGGGKRGSETANSKRGFVASSPRRNPLNTVFAPLVPATPTTVRKRNLSFRGTSLPADFSIFTTGTPTIAYDAEFGLTIDLKSGDKVVVVEKEGFDPNTTEMIDVLTRDWSVISSATETADALRVPWVGITAEPGPLADMLNVRAFTLNPATSYDESIHIRDNGVATNTAYGFFQPIGYGVASYDAKQRKDLGFRWFPKDTGNTCLELGGGGAETKGITTQMAMASATRGKRWHRFTAFEGTGVCKVAIRGLRLREYDTNPKVQVGKALSLSNPTPETGAAWTSLIQNHTVGSTITATTDGVTLTVGATDTAGRRAVSGTFSTAGAKTIRFTETPVGGVAKITDVSVTVAAPAVGATVIGTPTTQFNSGNSSVGYAFNTATPIGAASTDRYVFMMATIISAGASSFTNLTASITPAGGTKLPMTLVKRIDSVSDTTWATGSPHPIALFRIALPPSVSAAESATFEVLWDAGASGVRAACTAISVRNVNPALVDFAAAGAARGTNSDCAMPAVIDKRAGGLTMLGAFYSTSGSSFYGAAYEVPTATANDAPVASNNNQATQTITGLANIIPPTSALIEAGGAGGGTMLVVSFGPAS